MCSHASYLLRHLRHLRDLLGVLRLEFDHLVQSRVIRFGMFGWRRRGCDGARFRNKSVSATRVPGGSARSPTPTSTASRCSAASAVRTISVQQLNVRHKLLEVSHLLGVCTIRLLLCVLYASDRLRELLDLRLLLFLPLLRLLLLLCQTVAPFFSSGASTSGRARIARIRCATCTSSRSSRSSRSFIGCCLCCSSICCSCSSRCWHNSDTTPASTSSARGRSLVRG